MKSLNIEKDKFEAIVETLENRESFKNWSALFNKVADMYNELHGVSFSSACAAQRAKVWGIEVKTPKGERGATDGGAALLEWRKSGVIKESKPKSDCKDLINYYTKEEKGKFLPLAKKIKRGSLKAVIKLYCISCAGFEKDNVKTCPVTTCPIHPVRPYQ